MTDKRISALTALTQPAAADLFVVVDNDEAVSANKNKSLSFGNLHKGVPNGTESEPSIGFLSDINLTGFYRSGTNEIAVTANNNFIGKFTTAGFQLGTGTADAQLHLFSNDTVDQVVFENTDAGPDTAPDLVLYRNSASPGTDDNLGNVVFRGKNSAGQHRAYARIATKIVDTTDGSEDGMLQLLTTAAGSTAARIAIKSDKVGINELDPEHPLHITESVANTGLFIESAEAVAVSAADITLYHHRGSSVSGQDNDVLSSINFQGNNDASTPEQILFGTISASIVDASDTTEDGKLDFKVQAAGTLTSMAAITAANVTLGSRPIIPTHTPASATATGTAGEIAWDPGFVHVCTATNSWKRVALGSATDNERSIDELPAAAGIDPNSVTNWHTYFQHIGDNGGNWVLPNRTYTVSGNAVVFKVAGTKLTGQNDGIRPNIRITGVSSSAPTINSETAIIACGFWFANKTRIRGLDIEWSDPDNHKEKALLLFQKAYYSGNNSRADMDSSVDDCVFSARATLTTTGAGIITYLGRNMRVTGCTFSSGSGSGDMRAISLSYAQTASPEVDSDGQTATTGGFRKNIVRDNTFHMTKDAVCVEVFCATGSPTTNNHLYGLLITGNQNDVGGHLLKTTTNVRLVGAVISANVNFRSNVSHVLIKSGSSTESMVVTGNFFGGTDTDSSGTSDNYADGIEVESGASMSLSTITGNTFLRPSTACIKLGSSTKTVISGNTFSKDDRNSVPALSVVGTGVVIGNTSDCDTFITGTTSGWTQSSNI